jgi:hypothetical protein
MKNTKMNGPLSKQIFFFGLFFQILFAADTIEQTIQSAEIVINAFSGVESRVGIEHRHLTPHLHEIALYGHTLPDDVKDQLKELGFNFSGKLVTFERPDLEYHYDSPFFRFHYDLTGTHAVDSTDNNVNGISDYIDDMAEVFTHVYDREINNMNYNRPPGDGWLPQNYDNGGSSHYDIYITSLGNFTYGLTYPEYYAQNTGDNEYSDEHEIQAQTSYIKMNSNYNGIVNSFNNKPYGPKTELEAIKVTAAHEFFHAVQYGYDGWEEHWLLEATATWMEEMIYDDINDCYDYMLNWFSSPQTSLDASGSHWYGSYIFFKYIEEHLGGPETIRFIIEKGVETNSENGDYSHLAISDGLEPVGSSFQDALNKMAIANRVMSSNPGAGAEMYSYEEAEEYPVDGPNTLQTVYFSAGNTETVNSTNLQKYASQYLTLNTDTPALVSLTNLSGPESDLELHAIIKMGTGSHFVRNGSPINIDPSIGVEWISLAVVSQNTEGADWNYEVAIKDGEAENYSPLAFSIIAPTDSSIIDTSLVTFLWHRAIDSDEDDIVFYDVELGPNIQNLDTVYTGTDTTFSKHLSNNTIYHWRVMARDIANNIVFNNGGTFTFMIQMDDIAEKVVLSHPYPNPFPTSPVNSTRIKLILKESQVISIKIVNILGQEVIKLFSGELSAGFYDHLSWDGKMGNGKKAPSGIYFILVEGDQFHTWQKVTLLR